MGISGALDLSLPLSELTVAGAPLALRTPADRLREALALFEEGVALKERSLRRKYPEATEADLQAKLLRWLERVDDR